jgi:hypothetical protein
METEFKRLNPMMNHDNDLGHSLSFDCPYCGHRESVYVNYQGGQSEINGFRRWGLTHPDNDVRWESVSLSPSIQLHPHPRKNPTCAGHFSVTNGKITP